MDSNTGAQQEGTELVRKSFLTEITGTVLILLGLLALLSVVSFEEPAKGAVIQNIVGAFGHHSSRVLLSVFGNAAYLLGPYLMVTGVLYIKRGRVEEPLLRAVAAVVLLIAFSVVFYLLQGVNPQNFASGGGVVGRRFGHGLETSFGFYGALILAVGTLGTGALLATRLPAAEFLQRFRDMFERQTLIVRRSRPARENPAAPAFPTATVAASTAPIQSSIGSETLRNTESPPIIGVERTGGPARPWFTKVDMPDPRSPERAPSAQASGNSALSSPSASGSGTAAAERPPLIRRFEPAARTASLSSMLQELARRKPDDNLPSDAVEGRQATVLAGVFTADGQRYRFRDDRSVPTPGAARFAAHTTFPRASAAPALSGREGIAHTDGPLLRPIRIRVSDTSFAETGRTAVGRQGQRPTVSLELPAAEPQRTSAIATPAFIPEIEAMDENDPEFALSGDELRPLDQEPGFDPEGLLPEEEYEFGEVALEPSDDVDEPDEDSVRAGEVSATTATLRESLNVARASAPSAETRGVPGVIPESGVPPFRLKRGRYHIPTEILNPPFPVSSADTAAEIALTRQRLEQVLRDYGIQGKVVREQRGPIVTLFEVKLEPGVKVSRILGISDEIKMNLEAASVRILAPMPGRATIGIEIPNLSRETVVLGDVIRKDETFFSGRRELTIVLGKDIAGHNQYVDLTTLPHLLMAGATGSGKSVYLNTVIASLLYTRSPEDVRFIMIDPKMVELTLFEGIPHLLMPVITDVRMASKALAWVVGEMERRYAMLSGLRCRDIRSYNERAVERGDRDRLPYVVVLIDELSDLMMVAAKDVEDSIIRLTQKARAVGIHVIMATQRPSVDVITALIKANCPARIAFQVAQRTDSRTILDANGAEALVGRGDMLYKSPSASGLRRVQALLITEDEIERIVAEARRYGEPVFVDLPGDGEDRHEGESLESDADEGLFDEAWAVVQESGKTSTSYIQRRLRIGYNRAARLIEMMEERGYLGPAIGTRPREVLKKA